MTLSRYILSILIGTVCCWAALGAVIFVVNPLEGGMTGLILFYIAITCALVGTFALIGFCIRMLWLKQEVELHKVVISFRQAIFFALLVDGFLFLQSMRYLTWYNVVFLLFALTLAEFFIISRRPVRRMHNE